LTTWSSDGSLGSAAESIFMPDSLASACTLSSCWRV
jgi:hypothetical protein